jgi:hypothetical protein
MMAEELVSAIRPLFFAENYVIDKAQQEERTVFACIFACIFALADVRKQDVRIAQA